MSENDKPDILTGQEDSLTSKNPDSTTGKIAQAFLGGLLNILEDKKREAVQKSVGEALFQFRKGLELSPEDVCSNLQWSTREYRAIESGHTTLQPQDLIEVLQVYIHAYKEFYDHSED